MCIRDRPGRSVTPANRDRVRAALVSAHLRDLAVASRSGDGEREGAAGPRLDHNHGRHLRPPDHRGRQGDLGGCRLRRRTGIGFGPHWFRHTYATWLLRRGAGMESVKELLGHASITTTVDTYGHLTIEDARATLEAAGWFTGSEVRL